MKSYSITRICALAVLAPAICLALPTFGWTQSCGSDVVASCGCATRQRSCKCARSHTHVTLHVKKSSDDSSCGQQRLFRRQPLNIIPQQAATTAGIPVARVAYQPMMMQPSFQPQIVGFMAVSPDTFNASRAVVARPRVAADTDCCTQLEKRLKNVENAVREISLNVEKMTRVVNEHQNTLEEFEKTLINLKQKN